MKETCRVPRPPEIALNGNLPESHDSSELLSVLGFCVSEASAVQHARQQETIGRHVITTPCTSSDEDDHVYRTNSPLHTKREEVRLVVGQI
jgi:hypothetical protein